jgi:hypothetical protein
MLFLRKLQCAVENTKNYDILTLMRKIKHSKRGNAMTKIKKNQISNMCKT